MSAVATPLFKSQNVNIGVAAAVCPRYVFREFENKQTVGLSAAYFFRKAWARKLATDRALHTFKEEAAKTLSADRHPSPDWGDRFEDGQLIRVRQLHSSLAIAESENSAASGSNQDSSLCFRKVSFNCSKKRVSGETSRSKSRDRERQQVDPPHSRRFE